MNEGNVSSSELANENGHVKVPILEDMWENFTKKKENISQALNPIHEILAKVKEKPWENVLNELNSSPATGELPSNDQPAPLIEIEKIAKFSNEILALMNENLQYIASPTIDKIFNMQKKITEEFEKNVHGKKNINEELPRESHQSAGENLPDPLIPKRIQKFGSDAIRRKIPKKSLQILQDWLLKNIDDPYPSKKTKLQLAATSGLTFKQVHNWFINTRGRTCKDFFKHEKFSKAVEKKYLDSKPKAE